MDKIRLGIIGVGIQGSNYAGFLTGGGGLTGVPVVEAPKHIALAALCDINPEKKKSCAETYPGVPFYDDYREMIVSGKVDAVVTTVPHFLHPETAIFAIEHGVHALVEKPAAVYAGQVRQMNDTAAAHPDITFAIMFNQRTNKLYQRIRAIVASGELGEIRRSNWMINTWWRPDSYYRQSEWRATWGGEGGGVLVNQAPHQLDLWQWICGMPNKICAKVRYGAHRDILVENDVTMVSTYPNGATGCFITSTHDVIGTDRLEIDLDRGKIVVEGSRKAVITRLDKSEDEMNRTVTMAQLNQMVAGNAAGTGLYTTETFENSDEWGLQHITVMENFAQNILTGEPLLAPGSDGINGVNLANAAMLSGWLGREVDCPVNEEEYLRELNEHIRQEGKFPVR